MSLEFGPKNPEQLGYLNPAEQLILGSRVNAFCDFPKEEFDPNIHIPLAVEIVRALHGRLEVSQRISVTGLFEHNLRLPKSKAMTNVGEIDTSFDESQTHRLRMGKVREYKVGNYVITKRRHENFANLRFVHYREHGKVNNTLQGYTEHRYLDYDEQTMAALEIGQTVPTVKRLFYIKLVTYYDHPFWKKVINNSLLDNN